MKKSILLLLLFASLLSFGQRITRGPDIGEIYFMGPTTTDLLYGAIYHSTDFGETAVCVDSISALTNTIEAITADKTSGGVYYVNMGQALYYSANYGQYGTWNYKHGNITLPIRSGVSEGVVYKYIASHSENYGENFQSHDLNGFFGSSKDIAIDHNQGTCYCITELYGVNDTLYFFISNNNFNDLEVQYKFNYHWSHGIYLCGTNSEGSLFLYNSTLKKLLFSENYGVSWNLKNTFSCPNLPIIGITGGRQNGEVYLLVEYLQLMGLRRHVYIYHSLDYGETFTVYHPISIGPDPIYANFIAQDTLVEAGDTVQFIDLSNDVGTWEWDFDNDGIIDSYEQNPTHIYQDTGYYTVKLSVTGNQGVIQDYGIRYDYIHVDDLSTLKDKNRDKDFSIYPNPTEDKLIITMSDKQNQIQSISVYGLDGKEIINKYVINNNFILINTSKLEEGIYLVNIKTNNTSHNYKIIKK